MPCYGSAVSISANYPSPVTVNGFSCRNCADVDIAKKHIDPARGTSDPAETSKASQHRKADRARDRDQMHAYAPGGRRAAGSSITGTMIDVQA